MKISVVRDACCSADDQLGPLEMSYEVTDRATLTELAVRIADSKFLQFTSSHHTLYGASAGLEILSISSGSWGNGEFAFFVNPEQLVSEAVPDGQLSFRFRT